MPQSGQTARSHVEGGKEKNTQKHLDKQITAVTLLMRISDNNKHFEENFQRAFNPQKRLPLVVDVE